MWVVLLPLLGVPFRVWPSSPRPCKAIKEGQLLLRPPPCLLVMEIPVCSPAFLLGKPFLLKCSPWCLLHIPFQAQPDAEQSAVTAPRSCQNPKIPKRQLSQSRLSLSEFLLCLTPHLLSGPEACHLKEGKSV
jgi:hypothetical protein